jgi:Spy/CpxP family protein refolding chaperone
MKRLTAAIAFALIGAAVAVGAASAKPPGPGRPGPGGPGPEHLIEENADRLGIDDDTRDAIRKIAEASRERSDALSERLHAAHEEMRHLLDADEPDEDAVMAQAEAIGALHVDKHKNRLRALLEIRALLTPEQRQELVKLREEMGPPPWHRHRMRPGPPDPDR